MADRRNVRASAVAIAVALGLGSLGLGSLAVTPPAGAVPTPGVQPNPSPANTTDGYWMLANDGSVYAFGAAAAHPAVVNTLSVAIAAAPAGGYWVLAANGRVHARDADHHGDVDPSVLRAGERVASIAGRPQGDGYWIFTDQGRVFAFGAARVHGDMAGTVLNGAVVASAATPSGEGYWMVGADGGIFSFGDARFHGSTGAMVLNEPVVGIAPDPDGAGYWLVSADGGIFAFEAGFRGSIPGVLPPGRPLNRPVIGAIAYGDGYLMVAADGGIFAFSDKPFLGSLGADPPARPVVGVTVLDPDGRTPTTDPDQLANPLLSDIQRVSGEALIVGDQMVYDVVIDTGPAAASRVTARFLLPNGQVGSTLPATETATAGTYRIELTIGPGFQRGRYSLDSVEVAGPDGMITYTAGGTVTRSPGEVAGPASHPFDFALLGFTVSSGTVPTPDAAVEPGEPSPSAPVDEENPAPA